MSGKVVVIVVLALWSIVQFSSYGGISNLVVRAEDDILPDTMDNDEDLDAIVENEDVGMQNDDSLASTTDTIATDTESDKEEEDEDKPLKPSPDADTHILFIQPTGTDFAAGQAVKFLVGFSNKGKGDFVVDTMDAAFRYPQDYSFFIQNFTTFRYHQTVEPGKEATFEYGFSASESFSSRSFGLTVNLNYHDADGNLFQDAVFNTTINVIEPDEGLDGETFFLYLFLLAVAVLVIFGAHQLLSQFGKKHLKSKSHNQPAIEMGTQSNKSDVDYDWIPKEHLNGFNKPAAQRSPKAKTSPRQRTARRQAGSSDD